MSAGDAPIPKKVEKVDDDGDKDNSKKGGERGEGGSRSGSRDRSSRRDRRRSSRRDSRRDERRRRDDGSRSRSRSRRRRRSRSGSRDRDRRRSSRRSSGFDDSGGGGGSAVSTATQLQQLMVQQQQQQMLLANMQQMNAANGAGKKARELYVGNLAIGLVTDQVIRDFFNTAMLGVVPEEANNPAVVNVWIAPDMKYSFVEMRTPELATAGLTLDKMELCGRALNVGRPSGYVAPIGGDAMPPAPNPHAALFQGLQGLAQGAPGTGLAQAPQGPPPSRAIALENMLTVEDVAGDEYDDIVLDIKEECEKFGQVLKVDIPKPPPGGASAGVAGIGKAFVKFDTIEAAQKAKATLGGRTFDGRKVVAKFIDEGSFDARVFT